MTLATPIESPSLPASGKSDAQQLDALLHTVGVSLIDDLGWIRVTGSDRVRWLNGMVTNSIQGLQPGEGNYSFALNAQGQIQADLNSFVTDSQILLQTAKDRLPALLAHFDRFIIMDDVELEDLSAARFGCRLSGPSAPDLLQQIGFSAPPAAAPNTFTLQTHVWQDTTVDILTAHSPLVPRLELWTPSESTRDALFAELADRAATIHGGPVDPLALEHLRFLEGTPRFGIDIHEKTLAQETGQSRALHFSKGCYLGQEIVERIRSRGNVHRALTAFRLQGPLPPVGTAIVAEGKPIAELTSVATIPLASASLQLALGLARRDPIERGLPLTYSVGEVQAEAIPVPIPIQAPAITS